jgi:hypothetical protein
MNLADEPLLPLNRNCQPHEPDPPYPEPEAANPKRTILVELGSSHVHADLDLAGVTGVGDGLPVHHASTSAPSHHHHHHLSALAHSPRKESAHRTLATQRERAPQPLQTGKGERAPQPLQTGKGEPRHINYRQAGNKHPDAIAKLPFAGSMAHMARAGGRAGGHESEARVQAT